MENNIQNDVLKILHNVEDKLAVIDSNVQVMVNLDIYRKELTIQVILNKLNSLIIDYHNRQKSYSEYMDKFDEKTVVPACLVLAVLFIFDIFEPGMSRDELKGELSISKAEYEQGKRYKDKYYLISEPSKGESKNKLFRPDRKNRKRVRSGNYYAYSLQKLIDTLIEDIRRGII